MWNWKSVYTRGFLIQFSSLILWVTFSAFVETTYAVLCPKLLILSLFCLYYHSFLFIFSLSSFLLSLVSSVFLIFQYWYPWPFLGRFLPGFACSTLMFCFLISLFLPLFFLFLLPKSKFEILWLKITFVFQCSWYVPSLLNFLYLTVLYLDFFFVLTF